MWDPSIVLVVAYVSVLLLIASYGFHRYVLLYLYIKHKHNTYQIRGQYIQLPRITVQLPMYNEGAVAERIIKATCLIDYPRDKFEIQVLDDSTDHSADMAKSVCEERPPKVSIFISSIAPTASVTKPARSKKA